MQRKVEATLSATWVKAKHFFYGFLIKRDSEIEQTYKVRCDTIRQSLHSYM